MFRILVVIFIAIALVIGVYYVVGQIQEDEALLPEGLPDVSTENNPNANTTTDDSALLADIRRDDAFDEADLQAVDGSASSGIGYRRIDNSRLKHVVVAVMPAPGEGSVYEGWLVRPSPMDFFSTGVMHQQSDGSWLLEFTATEPFPDYVRVVITEETQVDETPETHVIEGVFN
ncbi:MAG: anti-sigma factor [Candidatus Spechtbacterales bacterium]